jgi:hypothetical protein
MRRQTFLLMKNSCKVSGVHRHSATCLLVVFLFVVGIAPATLAQDKPALTNAQLRQGDTVLTGTIKKGATAVEVQIKTDSTTEKVAPRVDLDSPNATFRITLVNPLKQGQKVQLRQNVDGAWSDWTDELEVQASPALEAPVLTNTPLTVGEKTLEGSGTMGATGIEAQINSASVVLAAVKLDAKKGTFQVLLATDLQKDQQVTVRQVRGAAASPWSAPILVIEPECTSDCRKDLEATFHAGTVLDTFAGSEVQKFVNPEASGGIQWRGSAGADFEYRAWGNRKKRQKSYFANSVWVYGESDYGARSAQFDCKKNTTFLNCQTVPAPPATGEEFFFIVRNAATLEAFGGLRWEFLALRPAEKKLSVNIYAKAQAGFLTISLPTTASSTTSSTSNPGNFAQMHHIGLGGIITNGYFQGSYFELGHGRTDLFKPNSHGRWKVDSFLTFPVKRAINFYIQLFVDSDLGNASDSVQTYFGFDLNLRDIPGWFQTKDKNQPGE